MGFTSRFREAVAVGGVLVLLSPVLGEPLLLLGGAAVFAWVLGRQAAFLAEARRSRSLELDISCVPEVPRGEELEVAVRAGLPDPVGVSMGVRLEPPLSFDGEPVRLRLEPGDREAVERTRFVPRLSGSRDLGPADVAIRSRLFRAGFVTDGSASVEVTPPGPSRIHIGEGGERVASAYGEYEEGRRGSGIVPEGIRRYVAGDPFKFIDWKVSARLGELHVDEFEAETDRKVLLILDHGSSMADGPEGRSKLDYVREVALSLLTRLDEASELVGLYTVGDTDLTYRRDPSAGGYSEVREWLRGLEATDAPVRPGDRAPLGLGAGLLDGSSDFGRRLSPFLRRAPGTGEVDPLVATVRHLVPRLGGEVTVVLFTDDGSRTRVLEAATLVAREAAGVSVFLTPTALFAPPDPPDSEAALERYGEFEGFRRRLARVDGVRAFEVGPMDDLRELLEMHGRGVAAP